MTDSIADVPALKTKLHAVWTAGDFDVIARCYQAGAIEFVEALGLSAGQQVLDVATGTGNLAVPAAKTGATVTGVDIAANSLATAAKYAETNGVSVTFEEGDCEGMTYDDASFDVVMSMFGAMFAPQPHLVTAELLRVCKPGGRIAMANWGKFGFVFELFSTVGRHAPPPPGMPSPVLWGEEDIVRERFGSGVKEWNAEKRTCHFVFDCAGADVVDEWRKWYGPIKMAFARLDSDGQDKLQADLLALFEKHNVNTDGTTKVAAEYLAITAVRA